MAVSEKVRRLAEGYVSLDEDERREFVALVATREGSEIGREWREEIRRRADDIDAGRIELVDGEDFLRQLRVV